MPNPETFDHLSYFNNQTLQVNPWTLLNLNTEQSNRLVRQTQLPCVAEVNEAQSHVLVTLDEWNATLAQLKTNLKPILGLVVNGFDEVETLQKTIHASGFMPDALFIDFPVFSDGRGYSLARILLRDLGFNLPIGAIGDVLQDQIFFYWRCGMQLIIPRHDQNLAACLASFKVFTHAYQPAQQQPEFQLSG